MKLSQIPPFRPFPGLHSPWMQTLAGRFWPQAPDLKEDYLIPITLSDGDKVLVAENRVDSRSAPEVPTVFILVHGLTGSYQSRYMTRLANKLLRANPASVVWRMNLRNCGPGFGHSRGIYHSGRSEDLHCVVRVAEDVYPNAKLVLLGISLGGNITLKYLGERARDLSPRVLGGIAISAPVDLARSAKHLSRPENAFFDRFFVRAVMKEIQALHTKFPDLPHGTFASIPPRLTDLDDLYTAPRGGFTDAADYYAQSSSYRLIPKINVPTLHICSDDDPVVFSPAYHELKDQLQDSALHTFAFSTYGGHVGFIGWPGTSAVRWMDQVIFQWLGQLGL